MSQYATDANGNKEWRNAAGQLHREDGPAVERANGDKVWYRIGQIHREDGPAVERADGTRLWFRNGQRHREDGPAAERANGDRVWWVNDQCHREDGPAFKGADGTRKWLWNDQLHREDGPAVEEADGTREWWIDGLKITQAQFDALPRDADGHLHSEKGALLVSGKERRWFWHGENVTRQAFEAHKAAVRMKGALGNAMESQAPQRSRQRIGGAL